MSAQHTPGPWEATYSVVRDCGYGKVWVRNADSMPEAEALMAQWQREGMRPSDPGQRGGDFRIVTPEIKRLQAECDAFNARYPVGHAVTLRRDNGDDFQTVTRSPAAVLSGHSAVIWLDGVRGCYLLDRVTPVTGGAA